MNVGAKMVDAVERMLEDTHINPHRPDYCTDVDVEHIHRLRALLERLRGDCRHMIIEVEGGEEGPVRQMRCGHCAARLTRRLTPNRGEYVYEVVE